MKIRIQDNSIRLRLTRTEVDRLNHAGEVKASAEFPGGTHLHYAVYSSTEAQKVEARFDSSGIVVNIPHGDVCDWAQSDQVSITGGEARLDILVEKDFACLKPREGEDESDMFPHPQQGRDTC